MIYISVYLLYLLLVYMFCLSILLYHSIISIHLSFQILLLILFLYPFFKYFIYSFYISVPFLYTKYVDSILVFFSFFI